MESRTAIADSPLHTWPLSYLLMNRPILRFVVEFVGCASLFLAVASLSEPVTMGGANFFPGFLERLLAFCCFVLSVPGAYFSWFGERYWGTLPMTFVWAVVMIFSFKIFTNNFNQYQWDGPDTTGLFPPGPDRIVISVLVILFQIVTTLLYLRRSSNGASLKQTRNVIR